MSRKRINKLTDVFIDELLSGNNDLGWRSGGMMSKIMMPRSPSRTDLTDARMISEIGSISEPHPDFPKILSVMNQLSTDLQDTLIAKNLKKHINKSTDRAWTDADRAEFLGLKVGTYKTRLNKAYSVSQKALDILDEYERSKLGKYGR